MWQIISCLYTDLHFLHIDSTFGDTLGLSTKEGKLPRKSLSSSFDIVKSLCRFSECVEMEVIYHNLWDKWRFGEIAGVTQGTWSIRARCNGTTIEWLWRLQVRNGYLCSLCYAHAHKKYKFCEKSTPNVMIKFSWTRLKTIKLNENFPFFLSLLGPF